MRRFIQVVSAAVILSLTASCSNLPSYKRAYSFSQEDLFSDLSKSVVVVLTDSGLGSGEAVAVDDLGAMILTCAHVIDEAVAFQAEIKIKYPRGLKKEPYSATVIDLDVGNDLALIYVAELTDIVPLKIAKQDPNLYSKVYIMGNALGKELTASQGTLTHLDRVMNGSTYWQVSDALFLWGMSGGPVVNSNNELLSVVGGLAIQRYGAVTYPFPALGYAVPRSAVAAFVGPYIQVFEEISSRMHK